MDSEVRSRRFLLNELKHLKDKLYTKLYAFKAKTEGGSKTLIPLGKKFEIRINASLDDFIKKEIDHWFTLSQILSSAKAQATGTGDLSSQV